MVRAPDVNTCGELTPYYSAVVHERSHASLLADLFYSMVPALFPCCAQPFFFFYRVIQNIIELKPRSKYILAVDDSKNTLEEVAQVRSGHVRCIRFKNQKVKKKTFYSHPTGNK